MVLHFVRIAARLAHEEVRVEAYEVLFPLHEMPQMGLKHGEGNARGGSSGSGPGGSFASTHSYGRECTCGRL